MSNKKNFALLGAAGYIAPKHFRAIKETGNDVIAALDPHDSVGVLDNYFPDAHFFTEFERFDRHIEKLKRQGVGLDYMSICTPNYLHDAHIRIALRSGADAICEKPLVLNPWNIDALVDIEKQTGKRIFTILQLRCHPAIVKLKRQIENHPSQTKHDINLTYITARGKWYQISWKGDESKSGGIATNIGVHFFDMLCWIFGEVKELEIHKREQDKVAGYLEFEKARVRWFLSIDANDLPEEIRKKSETTYRFMEVDGEQIDFTNGFSDLHTESYRQILNHQGYGIQDSRPSIELIHQIRNVGLTINSEKKHPFIGR